MANLHIIDKNQAIILQKALKKLAPAWKPKETRRKRC